MIDSNSANGCTNSFRRITMKQYTYGASYWRTLSEGIEREWQISNGLGGYGGHTIIGGGNRMYHGYLIASKRPPVERFLVFTRTQEVVTLANRSYDLTSQNYINWQKCGHNYLSQFTYDGLPTYKYQVEDCIIKKSVAMSYGKNQVVVSYEVTNGSDPVTIEVVPLFNYRDPGSISTKSDLTFDVKLEGPLLSLVPTKDQDVTISFYASEGTYHDRSLRPMNMTTPDYVYEENHFYQYENTNGFTGVDCHYTPYDIQVTLEPFEHKKFYFKCSLGEMDQLTGDQIIDSVRKRQHILESQAASDDDLVKCLTVSSDHFIVDRQSTGLKTVLAGYPWFNDWGRDTMIALHGLTLSTGRYQDAKDILSSFAQYVKNGLIPNNFPDTDTTPGYNTVDGSLWYFYAVDMYLKHTGDYDFIKTDIYPKLVEIVDCYMNGTDYAIKMDTDGLIIAGDGSLQLTWMDVMIGDWVVTPRNGKPVEINALWYNSLMVLADLANRFNNSGYPYSALATKVKANFTKKFWNPNEACLYDVVDENDSKIRCNQIWAVSLPYSMLDKKQSQKVVEKVYKHLYTPYGLRSLSPSDPEFVAVYEGKLFDRDASYHMGTTWGYPMGAFITAYCKVHDYSKEAVKEAYDMCHGYWDHLNDGCINGIAEIFDGEIANKGRGCYNQAWSVSELLRAYKEDVLGHLE